MHAVDAIGAAAVGHRRESNMQRNNNVAVPHADRLSIWSTVSAHATHMSTQLEHADRIDCDAMVVEIMHA